MSVMGGLRYNLWSRSGESFPCDENNKVTREHDWRDWRMYPLHLALGGDIKPMAIMNNKITSIYLYVIRHLFWGSS